MIRPTNSITLRIGELLPTVTLAHAFIPRNPPSVPITGLVEFRIAGANHAVRNIVLRIPTQVFQRPPCKSGLNLT
jgi:hypothetical protein